MLVVLVLVMLVFALASMATLGTLRALGGAGRIRIILNTIAVRSANDSCLLSNSYTLVGCERMGSKENRTSH